MSECVAYMHPECGSHCDAKCCSTVQELIPKAVGTDSIQVVYIPKNHITIMA